MKAINRLLLGSFWLFATAYVATMHGTPYPADWLVKAMPALSLAVLVRLRLGGRQSVLLSFALVLSAGGDIALSIRDDRAQTYFVTGLGLFLTAHLCYITAFALARAYQPRRLPAMIAFGVLAVTMTVLLIPYLEAMLIPVLLYILVITSMGLMATLNTQGGTLLIVGAALFFLSDATIAVNTFMLAEPHPVASYVIMPTYYAAQYCIAMAFVRHRA